MEFTWIRILLFQINFWNKYDAILTCQQSFKGRKWVQDLNEIMRSPYNFFDNYGENKPTPGGSGEGIHHPLSHFQIGHLAQSYITKVVFFWKNQSIDLITMSGHYTHKLSRLKWKHAPTFATHILFLITSRVTKKVIESSRLSAILRYAYNWN